jgi:hypothetical protein
MRLYLYFILIYGFFCFTSHYLFAMEEPDPNEQGVERDQTRKPFRKGESERQIPQKPVHSCLTNLDLTQLTTEPLRSSAQNPSPPLRSEIEEEEPFQNEKIPTLFDEELVKRGEDSQKRRNRRNIHPSPVAPIQEKPGKNGNHKGNKFPHHTSKTSTPVLPGKKPKEKILSSRKGKKSSSGTKEARAQKPTSTPVRERPKKKNKREAFLSFLSKTSTKTSSVITNKGRSFSLSEESTPLLNKQPLQRQRSASFDRPNEKESSQKNDPERHRGYFRALATSRNEKNWEPMPLFNNRDYWRWEFRREKGIP